MAKKPYTNDVAIAPFTLIDVGPLTADEVYKRLNFRRYIAARGSDIDPRATRDPSPCAHCGAPVEWAYTFKRDPAHAKGGLNYIYARCRADPRRHRWAFRNTDATEKTEESPSPTPTPNPEAPKEETTDMPTPTPTTAPAAADAFTALISSVVQATLAPQVQGIEARLKEIAKTATLDTDAVTKMVEAALNRARTVVIEIPSMPKARFTGKAHPILERVLTLIAAGVRFFMICGPAASGKSTVGKQVAMALQKKLTAIAMNETMAREELLGYRAPNINTGEQKYTASAVVEGWERGDVILFDEVDRANPNTLCGLNSIEQLVLYVPRSDAEGGSEAKLGEGGVVIATANTYGTGASRTYVGANQLDAAFLDRFWVMEVGYDRDLEVEITGSPEAIDMITKARKYAEEKTIRRPLTTRMARRAVTDAAVSKISLREAYKGLCKNAGWTSIEIDNVWA